MLIRLYFIVSFCVVVLYYSDEKERGSLEAGKVADMVILSDNPYEVDPEKLKDIKVEELILSVMPY